MIQPLDIFTTIVAAFFAVAILDIIIAIVIGFAIWRFLSGLDPMQKTLLAAFLIVVGLVLIVTVIGAEIGVIMVLAGALATVFNLVRPMAIDD